MTNKQLRTEIGTARYELAPMDVAHIEHTLTNLPKHKKRSIWERPSAAIPVAAAIMALMIFAMPPIVKAVGALIDQIFDARIGELDQYQALPEDDRIAQILQWSEAVSTGHDLDGAQAEFEGVVVTVSGIWMSPHDRTDTSRKDGTLQLSLNYSEIPAFDPNWIDFTLRYAGASYPANQNTGSYREQGTRATTKEDWLNEDLIWGGETRLYEGVLTTNLSFEVGQWKPEQKTEMLLEGSIDGKHFEIAFSFDPVKAHEESVREAAESLGDQDRNAAATSNQLKHYADAAVPVGAKGELNGMEFMIAEIALTDSELHISAGLAGVPETNPTIASHTYWIRCIYVDGRKWGSYSTSEEDIQDGAFTFIDHFNVEERLPSLPEESLICVEMQYNQPGETSFDAVVIDILGHTAFKYNWSTKTVTLPRDAAEQDEWIAMSLEK